jgi:hypothetical protein
MDTRPTALALAALLLCACTVLTERRAGDRPDGSADAPPDFDPDTCGLWGQVYLESEENINIDTADPTLDGQGDVQAYLMTWDGEGGALTLSHMFDDVDALNRAYYCVPADILSDATEGFIFVWLVDTWSYVEESQANPYRSIISDPLVQTLYLLSLWYPGTDYSVYTDLYWDGTTDRFDIPLSVRTSRLEAEVEFDGFDGGASRNARLCAYAVGMREDPEFRFEAIGSSYLDLLDSQISTGNVLELPVNLAVKTGQQWKVFVHYIEGRDLYNGSEYTSCGDYRINRSCDCKSGIMADPEGTILSETPRFVITPIAGRCDLDETSICE